MVGPPAKKAAVRHLVENQEMSERRACELVAVSRSTVRYEAKPKEDEGELQEEIRGLASENPRYGCRRIAALLKRSGRQVNEKRVHRIWKEEGLALKKKRPKRRRYGPKGEVVQKAERKNHVWTYDFMEDRTERGGRLRILNVLDEYTRESLMIWVRPWMGSREVLKALEWLFLTRGAPEHIRSDNGSEFIAAQVQEWLKEKGSGTIYIEPGSPWENPYIESFNGKFRDECLNREIFRNEKEAQEVVENWRQEYNRIRPHSSLGYLTPEEFASRCGHSVRPTASLHDHNGHRLQTA